MNESKPGLLKTSPREILFIFFFKLHVIVGVFFVIVVLTATYAFSVKPVYIVSGSLLLKPFIDSRQKIFTNNRFSVAPITLEDINTEIKILTSRELALKVIEKLGLIQESSSPSNVNQKNMLNNAIISVRAGLDISAVTMSNVIRIAKKGSDPKMITKIVNTYMECYIQQHIEVHKSKSGVAFYEHRIQMHEKKLSLAKDGMKKKQDEWSIADIQDQTIPNMKLLEILRERSSRLASQIAEKEKKVSRLSKSRKPDGNFSLLPEELRNNGMLMKLEEAYAPLLIEREKISSLYLKNSTERRDIERQVERIQDEILKIQKQFLDGMRVDLEALKANKSTLDEYISQIDAESRYLAGKKIEQKEFSMKFDQLISTYKLYMNRLDEAYIAEERNLSGVANVSVVSSAYLPLNPIFPKKKIILAVALIAGAIAGIGSGVAAYYLDHTVKEPRELAKWTEAPVLSSLKSIKRRT
jgi:uncharacterized protein involved in exopolysaccharide biosynthesis